jgi:uncharacterized membrane protein
MSARSIRILLILSLTLNVFVVGALAGGAYMWRRAEQAEPSSTAMVGGGRLRLAGEKLSPEHRRPFRQALREARRASAVLIEQSRQGRAEAARLLTQPVVDQGAVRAALARARAADFALRARLEERVVAFAATLPPEERAVLAEGLERRASRRQR